MITEIAFVVIPVTDIAGARKFYEGALELKPTTEAVGGSWIEYEIGPHTLAIGAHPEWKPSSDGTSTALEVDDFPGTIQRLKNDGVKFSMDVTETPVCHMAIIHDPDGNKLLIHKRKPQQSK
jgi:predicted enzyme related to lactoylglutathione lyase